VFEIGSKTIAFSLRRVVPFPVPLQLMAVIKSRSQVAGPVLFWLSAPTGKDC